MWEIIRKFIYRNVSESSNNGTNNFSSKPNSELLYATAGTKLGRVHNVCTKEATP